MKQNLTYQFFVLIIISLIVAGCASSPDQIDLGFESGNSSNADEGMVFDEDETEDSDEIVFDEDESEGADDEMIFEDEEGILITASNTPPSGIWLWTNSEPLYEGCPADMSNAAPPPDPPLDVEIESFEKGDILLISTDTGAVELYRSAFSETASIYEATVVVPITDGEDLEVQYYLDFNFFEDGAIEGTLTSLLPAFDGCQAIRGFSAEYRGP